jgi:cell surface protein SprA
MDGDADRNGAYTDSNGDGRMNLDGYEVRSRYYLGRKQILNRDFSIKIHSRSRVLSSGETAALGSYSIDYSDGIIYFNLREPFRQLLASGIKDVIYAEKQADSVADSSAYYIKADYYSESRSFQLKHMNIIEGSDRIKINNRVLDKSLYTIDRTSGYLSFNNADNPQISSDTVIEVKYEYLPLGGQSQDFVGGVRADYQLSKNISLGGSALMTRSSGSGVIPLVNSEPVQTIVVEGDTSVNLDGGTLAGFSNLFPDNRKKPLPLEIKGYAEYARSYRNINTFGKGLVRTWSPATIRSPFPCPRRTGYSVDEGIGATVIQGTSLLLLLPRSR